MPQRGGRLGSGTVIEVVGLGDAGWPALGEPERELLRGADVLLGGARHLALVPAVEGQERRTWPTPLRQALPALLADLRGRVVVLASGDPLRSGVGTTLLDLLGPEAVRVHPAVSSDTLARARLGWAAETTDVVTTVGRDLEAVLPLLTPGARVVVLCSDGRDPARLGLLLTRRGLGQARLTALWHLGGVAEGSRAAVAAEWADATDEEARTPDLVVCAVEVPPAERLGPPGAPGADAAALAASWGTVPGRPEDCFEHDGQITKRDVRAGVLARLRPTPGAHLWDLGAGSGAVGVEWCLAAPRATCTSVERDADRSARIGANARHHGVGPRLTVRHGDTADLLRRAAAGETHLPRPDAVFVGGGASEELLDLAWRALPVGGRLVADAVTLEGEAVLVRARQRLGGELTRVSVEHATTLGRYLSWTPARAVVQLSCTRKEPRA